MVFFGKKWFYSDNVVVFGQSGSLREKWMYWDKSGCIRAKMVVFGQSGRIREKWLYLCRSGCIRAKWSYLGKSGCNLSKVVVFWQKLL